MTRRKAVGCQTLDLFRDYVPGRVVPRFEAEDVKAWNLQGRIAKAVARTLDEAGKSREEVAGKVSEILGEKVSKATLDAYASQAKDSHQITAARLAALVEATGDARALNTLLADFGLIAVPDRYEALLRREAAREARERFEREEQAADAEWRARR